MTIKLLTAILCLSFGMAANAANEKVTVEQVTEPVQLTANVDYIITGKNPFATVGNVDIVNTEHAVLIISQIKPSKIISNWLPYIYINGQKAVDGENCQVKMYGRGTIIFPYAKGISPLTCYTEQNFEGESCSSYTEGHSGGFMKTLNTSLLNNKIRSFKLKRGYMVTFAIGTGGWGYSRCFIADQEDLEVKTLPSILDQRISSYRIFKWHNAHKAGLASNGSHDANQALNTSWCYDWAEGNGSNLPDTEWVPNHIYEDWPSPAVCGSVSGSCHMKTNNEPKNPSDDHPQELSDILNNWQNLMRTGMRLCSPASWDGSDYWNGTGFIKTFLDSIDARGWRCDIVDAHGYWPEGNFNHLKDHWYPNMHRPIWISEWIWGASWNNNGAFANGVTSSQVLNTTKQILETLNNMGCVERYAYWNSERTAHIYENGLTELGKYYATMDVGLGYNAAYEFIPRETRLEGLSELSSTYNRAKETVVLKWTDPNGDLISTINVQCKLPEETLFKTIATITPKDKNSAEGISYAYTDTVGEPGAYIYRVQAVAHNNKRITTEEVTINVAPSKGTDNFQYGKLTVGSTDATTTYYSGTFNETPCVFTGAATNKNTKFYAGNIVKNNKTNFTYQFMPWATTKEDNLSNTEEVPFLALQEGLHKFDGLDCEVGIVTSNKATSSNPWTDITEVTFQNPFPEGVTPVVFAEIRNPSYTTSSTSKTSLVARVFDVTNTGFKFIIYPEKASSRKVAIAQNVQYLAITPGIGTVDSEQEIIISAGHGTDSPIYGVTMRDNFFYANGTEEPLKLYSPTVLAALQTNNYPVASMLRRTNITQDDENGTTWTTGVKIKRILEHEIEVDGETISSSSGLDKYSAYRDQIGWIAISTYVEGSSAPTEINHVNVTDNASLQIRIVNGKIYVNGTSQFHLYSITGRKLPSNTVLTSGFYIVQANGMSKKVLVK